MTAQAWELDHDPLDGECVAALVAFPGSEDITSFSDTDPEITIPRPIEFEADVKRLDSVPDYPANDVDWPIVSGRLLDVLRGFPSFECEAIPVVMIDDTVPPKRRRDAEGNLLAEHVRDDYFALRLPAAVALDWGHSRYSVDDEDPEHGWMNAPAFTTSNLPPLFRVPEMRTTLFVSQAARDALAKAGCRGAVFGPSDQMMTPIWTPQKDGEQA